MAIPLLVFLTTWSLFWLVLLLVTARRRLLLFRMQQYAAAGQPAKEEKTGSRPGLHLAGFTGKFGALITGKKFRERLSKELLKANLPLRSEEFVSLTAGAFLLPFLLVFGATEKPLPSFLLGLLVALTPRLFLHAAKQNRLRRFHHQLGDAIVLIANSLRAGYSFLQAVEMVSREMPAPIGEEFMRLLKELNLGIPTEEALINLAKRVESDDLDLVVTAVLIQRQSGGNLAEVLDNISHTIRERVKIKGQIRTLTAQGRFSGVIVSLLPVGLGLFLFIVNPSYILQLFQNPIGWLMLALAAWGQIIGALIIKKVITIEV